MSKGPNNAAITSIVRTTKQKASRAGENPTVSGNRKDIIHMAIQREHAEAILHLALRAVRFRSSMVSAPDYRLRFKTAALMIENALGDQLLAWETLCDCQERGPAAVREAAEELLDRLEKDYQEKLEKAAAEK
ncbi:MAG: hypothetical protein H7A48_13880 [Akkermansiaceae bacterium]|nr:hypothetical protein [Akkermansiaceae bacterium]MCP5547362.1 hypothetical protein [Akkermansiaceae bacterium]